MTEFIDNYNFNISLSFSLIIGFFFFEWIRKTKEREKGEIILGENLFFFYYLFIYFIIIIIPKFNCFIKDLFIYRIVFKIDFDQLTLKFFFFY